MRNPWIAPTVQSLFGPRAKPGDDDLDAFFPHIRLANGTFKTTRRRRHDDVDRWFCDHWLANRSPSVDPPRMLDVAVSSGVATVEWCHAMTRAGIEYRMHGCDLSLVAHWFRFGPISLLMDGDHVYQTDIGPLAFPNTPPSRLGFLSRRLGCWLYRRLGHRFPPRPIQLLCEEARRSSIEFRSGDVFGCLWPPNSQSTNADSQSPSFDVIRVSNLLNLAYFREDQILRALENLKRLLSPGGLLVVNRSDESGERCQNHATLFCRREDRLIELASLGGGNEVAGLLRSPAADDSGVVGSDRSQL